MIGEGGVNPPQCRYGNLKFETLESPDTNHKVSPEQEVRSAVFAFVITTPSRKEFFNFGD